MGAETFWKSSPRAVLLMYDAYKDAHGGKPKAQQPVRLNRIPR